MEIPFHLIKDIFGGSSEDNGAGSGSFAINKISEVIISNFANIKKTTLGTNITLLYLFGSVYNFCPGDTCYTYVICFTDSSDARNVAFQKEVLGEIRHTFFSNYDIGFPLQYEVAHHGYFFHFLIESIAHSVLVS